MYVTLTHGHLQLSQTAQKLERKVVHGEDRVFNQMKRIRALPAFFISCGSVAFLAASLSTQFWITSDTVKLELEADDTAGTGSTDGTKYRGEIHFGLFRGTKWLNPGVGVRPGKLTIACSPKDGVCMYSDEETVEKRTKQLKDNLYLDKQDLNSTSTIENPHLLSFGVWTFTVVTVAISLFFGLIAAIFSVVNAVITPVEFITGYQGLFVWSGLGGLSALMAVCSWAAMYHSTLKNSVMNKEEMSLNWKSEGLTSFGYSYWFVLIAMFLYCINIVVLALFIKQPWKREQTQPTQSKNPEGAIMLY